MGGYEKHLLFSKNGLGLTPPPLTNMSVKSRFFFDALPKSLFSLVLTARVVTHGPASYLNTRPYGSLRKEICVNLCVQGMNIVTFTMSLIISGNSSLIFRKIFQLQLC